jgi:hypothetical protein
MREDENCSSAYYQQNFNIHQHFIEPSQAVDIDVSKFKARVRCPPLETVSAAFCALVRCRKELAPSIVRAEKATMPVIIKATITIACPLSSGRKPFIIAIASLLER